VVLLIQGDNQIKLLRGVEVKMTMTNFITKWAKKVIMENESKGTVNDLLDWSFVEYTNYIEQIFKEMKGVKLAAKYKDLEEEEVQEMLVSMIDEKISEIIEAKK
jgi:hypothetical protein